MFNGFLYFRNEASQREVVSKSTGQKRQAQLLRGYKQTLSQRLEQMSKRPVVQQSEVIRRLIPSPRSFRFTARDRFERISEAVQKHTCLDAVPLGPRRSVPRERLKTKEIQPELRFQPKDRHSRIREAWDQRTSSWTVSQSRVHPFPNKESRPFFKTIETLTLSAHIPGHSSIKKAASQVKISARDKTLFNLAERVSVACGLGRAGTRSTSLLKQGGSDFWGKAQLS